ncbi:hypothetical protein SARC_04662 [Sphaeroforma arctica JP610]|uniref:Uncharacterized protein n=1 Tax=Sphaeroforma arctica JP610 TaxID=667725 RepID=A0A0L0G2L7_9EUKA|nr:hypothetical protein SARC_04662 [Sphaeroforma arctica JP610]KNC83069.1 hypothetical protein SARC_04662 [Sphaeroforma arctica JP610]|eukprot:XP_014156971.1 hypothetical protein SARC_04662 [Sphaeroforma arctica JP610]
MKEFMCGALIDDADMRPYSINWVQTQMNETLDSVTGTTPAHYFRGRYRELQVPFNKGSQEDHVLPWLEKMRRTRNVVFPCLREMKDIALKKRQKRWNNSKKIVEFEVGDKVNIIARNSDTIVLTAKCIGSFKISVADKKRGTYEVNNVDGSSSLNIGSHRIPTTETILRRTREATTHLMSYEIKKTLGKYKHEDMTCYTTEFTDGVQYDLPPSAFDDPDVLKAFNKKIHKRLHNNKADAVAIIPTNKRPDVLKVYPLTSSIPSFKDHEIYVPPKGTKKRPIHHRGPQGPKPKRNRVTE